MQNNRTPRILDLDLDFFLDAAASGRESSEPRLDPGDYTPWPLTDVMTFLRERCRLDGPLPGAAVEHHGELFGLWRDAIARGQLDAPFSVTHVDAHADLGQGDSGWTYLMSELLFQPLDVRAYPRVGSDGLGDGNYLAFAIANRWISDLTYVAGKGGGDDAFPYYREGSYEAGVSFYDRRIAKADLQLPAIEREALSYISDGNVKPAHFEPVVPFTELRDHEFTAPDPFDFIFIARSPAFTPAESDPIYDAIRAAFVDESEFGREHN